MPHKSEGLKERLSNGGRVLVAEGYLFEFERRGYLKAGPYVPEVVLEHPELVKQVYEEFAHAGTDVIPAFTYFGHREKMREVGREEEVETLNRAALRLAREVASAAGILMAGTICNTTIYDSDDSNTWDVVRNIFKESVTWAAEEGADFIIGETFSDLGEAKLALEAIQEYGKGIPAVITFAQVKSGVTCDGYTLPEACSYMENKGASVVGLNCSMGPEVMISLMKEIRQACKGPIAALPVAYRTTSDQPLMQDLVIPHTGKYAFPKDLDYFGITMDQITQFAKACQELKIEYTGFCCGNSSRYFRHLAESFGRLPKASRYAPGVSEHYIKGLFGNLKHVYSGNVPSGM